jgi:hypothetical protein
MNESALLPSFLEEILQNDSKHYLWLRSLSYLEYIGYRKMVRAVPYTEVNLGVFHHLNDEIQHSFILKELAEKSFGRPLLRKSSLEELVQIAEDYFQAFDSRIHDWVIEKKGAEDPFLCYLLVSYVIEKLAMKVYPQYFARLTTSPLKLVIQKIIKEESEHLAYLERMMRRMFHDFSSTTPILFEFEEAFFEAYLRRMNQYFDQWVEAPAFKLPSKRTAQARASAR